MHSKGGSPVAFVEYQEVRYAAQAMAALQGSFLLSSDRGAIRIEYAKTKMAAEVCSIAFTTATTNLSQPFQFIVCSKAEFCHCRRISQVLNKIKGVRLVL
ncbi:RNA-binding protein mde7-like [Agrilus planipennis]|uniref:RNA-binding protein mde7-like n=1 Tax=Agrilus planipennis TaxID=224129 RepID=A0A1W4XBA0_AGRPL|nr:RNA-binding protein mde7-like [Agrilus planipennis]